MAKSSPYDDPAILNRFLDVIRGNAQSAKSATQSEKPESKLNPANPDFSPKVIVAGSDSGFSKTSSRPDDLQSGCQQGATASLLAPYHSPFPHVSIAQRTAPVDLVQDQNGIVTEPTTPPAVQDKQRSLMQEHPNTAAATDGPPFLTPTQHRLLVGKKSGAEPLKENKLAELSHQTQGYMDSVIDRFRKSKERILGQNSVASGPRDQESNMDATDAAIFHQNDETSIGSRVSQGKRDEPGKSSWQEKAPDSAPCRTLFADSAYKTGGQQSENDCSKETIKSPEVVPFLTFAETAIAKCSGNVKLSREEQEASTTMISVEDEPPSTSALNLHRDSTVEWENSGEEGVPARCTTNESSPPFTHTQSPTIVVIASTETDDSAKEGDDGDEEEDRENLARFKSWGAPALRNKPRSRPRTIILSGLPRGADFTLVQSLIHGGAIECMRLISSNPQRVTISAHVTFTSADACDRYIKEYPNGMEVRYQGKRWSVLVHKKDHVDVISGMLQGYLDCGATRVVKVSGADDDWGIVALNRLAEGKTGARQVEAVQDTYHNETRTIVFRFANISHAVQFKGILIRSDDWEGCRVEFAEDPCEKATGLRND